MICGKATRGKSIFLCSETALLLCCYSVIFIIPAECLPPAKLCADGVTCISGDFFCDGVLNCPDGSDESEERCGKNVNSCKSVFLNMLNTVSSLQIIYGQ